MPRVDGSKLGPSSFFFQSPSTTYDASHPHEESRENVTTIQLRVEATRGCENACVATDDKMKRLAGERGNWT